VCVCVGGGAGVGLLHVTRTQVCAVDRPTINRLTMLLTAGVKTVHPPDTPEPEDFHDPPDPPGPPRAAAMPVPPPGVYNANGVSVEYGGAHSGSARTLNLRRQVSVSLSVSLSVCRCRRPPSQLHTSLDGKTSQRLGRSAHNTYPLNVRTLQVSQGKP